MNDDTKERDMDRIALPFEKLKIQWRRSVKWIEFKKTAKVVE